VLLERAQVLEQALEPELELGPGPEPGLGQEQGPEPELGQEQGPVRHRH